MNIKRIAIIAGFILFVLGMALLLYYTFFRATPPPTTPPPAETPSVTPEFPTPGAFVPPSTTPTPPSELPVGQRSPAETIAQANGETVKTNEIQRDRNIALAGTGTTSDSVVAYSVFNQTFYRITPDGAQEVLSEQQFPGATTINFTPTADKAIIEFYDGSNILYNFTTKKQVTLPKHWREFSFDPNGTKIAFKSLTNEPDANWLAVANDDGTAGQQVEPLGVKGGLVDVTWSPSDQIIATFREGVDGFRQKIYFLGKNGENFPAMTVNGRDFESKWSPGGTRLVYSAYSPESDLKPQLWVVDALGDSIGNNRRNLQLNTWIDKCAFASASIMYCAVPSRMDNGAGVVRSLSDKEEDYIYRINIDTGEKFQVARPEGRHTIESIVIAKDNLFFTDKNSGKLYTIKIK